MEDFVAYPSRWRIALYMLGAWAFVIIGLWMLGVFGQPPASGRHSPEFTALIGWSGVLFFGFCGIQGLRRLFERGEQLRIGPAGIRIGSQETIPWTEIVDVTTWRYRGQKALVLHLRDRTRAPQRGVAGMLARANQNITGGDVSISLSTTNRSIAQALAAIERFRPVS